MTAEAGHLSVETELVGDRLVVAVAGEVDAATAPDLDGAVDLGESGVTVVELRLDQVTFIDSSGLRALLLLRERVVAAGAVVTLGSASSLVERLLEVTGLTETFPTPG